LKSSLNHSVLVTSQDVICLHILHKCILMQLKVGYAFSLRFGNIAIKKIHNFNLVGSNVVLVILEKEMEEYPQIGFKQITYCDKDAGSQLIHFLLKIELDKATLYGNGKKWKAETMAL